MSPSDFRAALAELGLSQAEFGRQAGVPPNTVNRWMRRPAIPPLAAFVITLLQERREIRERLS